MKSSIMENDSQAFNICEYSDKICSQIISLKPCFVKLRAILSYVIPRYSEVITRELYVDGEVWLLLQLVRQKSPLLKSDLLVHYRFRLMRYLALRLFPSELVCLLRTLLRAQYVAQHLTTSVWKGSISPYSEKRVPKFDPKTANLVANAILKVWCFPSDTRWAIWIFGKPIRCPVSVHRAQYVTTAIGLSSKEHFKTQSDVCLSFKTIQVVRCLNRK